MKKLLSIFSILLISAVITEATAQNYVLSNSSGIGPKIGYYKAPDADDGTMFVGLQSRMKGKYLGAEFSVEYRGEQSYSTTNGKLTVSQIPVTGSLMVFAPLAENLAPYGLAGLGAYYSIYDYDGGFVNPGDDTDVTLGYHLGFGAEVALSKSAAISVDYRYLFLDGNDDAIANKEFSGNVISAGLTFYF